MGELDRRCATDATQPPIEEQCASVDTHRELGRGLLWLGGSNLLAKSLDALSAVFVLRFLSREELGLATLAWTTTTLVEAFNGFGIGGALIQSSALSDKARASAHWYAVLTSALLTMVVYALAPRVAVLYHLPQLSPLIQVSSVKLLLVGFANVPLALASRNLQFERLAAIAVASTILASTLTILLAAFGWGSWAPVLGNASHGAFQFIGVLVLAPMFPRLTLSWSVLRPLARTGWALAGSGAIGQITRNVDYWLLGRVGGAASLGSYRVAFELAMLPTFTTLQVASRSALPVYARLATSPESLATAVAWTARTASLTLLAPLLLVFIEGEALLTALGKSSDFSLLLTIRTLCVAAFIRAATQFALSALVATGRSRLALLEATVSAMVLAVSLSLSLVLLDQLDPQVRTAFGWLAAWLLLLPFELILARRLGRGVGRRMMKGLAGPVLVAVGVGLVCWSVQHVSPLAPGVVRLLVHGSFLLTLYALSIRYVLGIRVSQLRRFNPPSEP